MLILTLGEDLLAVSSPVGATTLDIDILNLPFL